MREAMTHVAWKNHVNGAKNPRAQFQKEVSKEKIEAAPTVAGRLGVFDCSGVSDGSACALIVRAEDAEQYTDKPALREGAVDDRRAPHPARSTPPTTTRPSPRSCAAPRTPTQQAGVSDPREEISMAEVHDCFTPTELVLMEDMGFSDRGQAWRDELDGDFDLDGRLPVNPDGGLKSLRPPGRRQRVCGCCSSAGCSRAARPANGSSTTSAWA